MRILFITSTRIGDAILSCGLLAHLIETMPNPEITVACGPLAAPLFAGAPHVVDVHVMDKGKYAAHWRGLLKKTMPQKWDLVVDLRGSATAYLLRTKKRAVLKSGHKLHRVEHIAGVLNLSPAPAPKLWPSAQARARAKSQIGDGEKVLALGPTANWPKKMWPLEYYVDLVQQLRAPGGLLEDAKVIIAAGPGEESQIEALLNVVPENKLVRQIGGDLLDAYALFECADLYIGNDSGLTHLAAAASTPTIGLFGPTPDDLYSPWGVKASSLRGPRSCAEILADPEFDHHDGRSAMYDLTVEAVLNAARQKITT